jgi:uncharacterized protein
MGKKAINSFIPKKLLFLFIIFILAANASAQELPNFQDKHVNDFAHVFSDNESQQLKTILIELEQNTTAEVVVVTVNTTFPLTPAQYRTELFNYWKIGKADKDNGLLILYSRSENRIEVETGYGLEGILPDSKLGRMLDDYYVPQRDNGNVTQGILSFTQEVSKVIKNNSAEILSPSKNNNYIADLFPYIIFILIFIAMSLMSRRKNKKCAKDGLIMKYIGMAGGYSIYKCANGHIIKEKGSRNMSGALIGAGMSGGGGGFGGGGFGGGMSGGGGAGR